jgi:hypothetical protein
MEGMDDRLRTPEEDSMMRAAQISDMLPGGFSYGGLDA